ncbi:hypothetical protein EYZ11_003030 [Aspergillus tanneri]|uniref:Uncharacterized protein n=1 Tax=Aspergillus tanneri TaxID=1220188 RepID=A0A4S3JPD0_9EURO|nr:hypothetical protein EYZ11_003030 [Aspergillus tanneri]
MNLWSLYFHAAASNLLYFPDFGSTAQDGPSPIDGTAAKKKRQHLVRQRDIWEVPESPETDRSSAFTQIPQSEPTTLRGSKSLQSELASNHTPLQMPAGLQPILRVEIDNRVKEVSNQESDDGSDDESSTGDDIPFRNDSVDDSDCDENSSKKADEITTNESIQGTNDKDGIPSVELLSEDQVDSPETRSKEFSPSQQLRESEFITEHGDELGSNREEEMEIVEESEYSQSESESESEFFSEHGDKVGLNREEETVVVEESGYSQSESESESDKPPAASDIPQHSPDVTETLSPVAICPDQDRRSTVSFQQTSHVEKMRERKALSTSREPSPEVDGDISSEGVARDVTKSVRGTPNDTIELLWFREASELGGQGKNWNTLIRETRTLAQTARPSKAKYFKGIKSLSSKFREKYAEIVSSLDAQCSPSPTLVHECDTLFNAISREADLFLDKVFNIAKRSEEHQWISGELAEEFEAHVFPLMVKLTLTCFEAYCKKAHELFARAQDHVDRAMRLFLRLCARSYYLETERYVQFKARGQCLLRPLKKLIEALNNGSLKRERGRERFETSVSAHDIENVNKSVGAGKEWTDAEGIALLDGLKLYQDRDRYSQILVNFGTQLRGRTVDELRTKAQEILDAYLPTILKQAPTQEEQQQWQWLLSVRGS